MELIDWTHGSLVHTRRVRILSQHLSKLLPRDSHVLDVGCGDGKLASRVMEARPDLDIRGVDVLVRGATSIPVQSFDGIQLPHEDNSVDAVTFVDVLHHTEDPVVLLNEAKRVARQAIVIKDHTRDGFLAGTTLRFMDRVGNARYGVSLPYNYWPKEKWLNTLNDLELGIEIWNDRLGLYPWPASMVFERSLHFLAKLSTECVTRKFTATD